MNVSLRSQMTAGVAALSAAVVAVAPITQPDLLPSAERVAAAIQLSDFSNPITAITGNIFYATESILNQNFLDNDFFVWPESFYGVDPFDPESFFLYAPSNFGLIPDLVNQLSDGPLSGLVNNLSGYGEAGIDSVLALVNGVANAGFNAPFAAFAAVQELIAGNPEAALQTLVEAIVAPLQYGVEYALAGVGYIVDNIIENIQIGFTTLPLLGAELIDSVVGSVSLIVESLADTAASFVANLADLNIEGAWNAVVDGLLGESSTLSLIVGQTIGLGYGDFVGEDQFEITVPSPRAVLTSGFQRLGGQKFWADGGITNFPFFGPQAEATAAVTAPAPVAAVQVSAPAVAMESAPAVVEAPAVPEAVVEAPAPVSEPAAKTEVADVAAPAVRESNGASAAPSVSAVKSRVGDDSAVSTGTSAETDTSTGAGPTGATAGDSGSVNESSAPKKSSPRGHQEGRRSGR